MRRRGWVFTFTHVARPAYHSFHWFQQKSLERERSVEVEVEKNDTKVQFKDRGVFREEESHDEGSTVKEEKDDDTSTQCSLPQDLPDEVLNEEELKLCPRKEDDRGASWIAKKEASVVAVVESEGSVDKWVMTLVVFAILFFLLVPMLAVYVLCRHDGIDAQDFAC